MKKDRLISLRLDEATYQRLKSLADRSGASLSTVIRRHLEAPVQPQIYVSSSPSITFPFLNTWNSNGRAA